MASRAVIHSFSDRASSRIRTSRADSATHIRKVLQDALKAIEKAVPQYS